MNVNDLSSDERFNRIHDLMDRRGYSLTVHGTDRTWFGYCKREEDIGAKVRIQEDGRVTLQLEYTYGSLTIMTSVFDFDHPKFEQFYEEPLMDVIITLT